MFIELHILQNFGPSNLNRDDTNSPKDCDLGGVRRARISSQCSKRAMRCYFKEQNLLPHEHLAERSKKFISEITAQLVQKGRDENQAGELVKAALAAVSLVTKDGTEETQYLLFLGRQEIQALTDLVDEHWDTLCDTLKPETEATAPEEGKKDKTKNARKKKEEAKKKVPDAIAKQVKAIFNGGKAADLALFGRMLADQASLNIDAACQVAHAISTNEVSLEMDFFTAVDDLKQREQDPGAGMLGTVEFNSACYYRYANIDFNQLQKNLQQDTELALKTVEAFLKGAIHSIPTGKQNSFAAHNPPSLVLAVVREHGLCSLTNAFEKPIYADRRQDKLGLVGKSIEALDHYWGRIGKIYGTEGLSYAGICKVDENPKLEALQKYEKESVNDVISEVITILSQQATEAI